MNFETWNSVPIFAPLGLLDVFFTIFGYFTITNESFSAAVFSVLLLPSGVLVKEGSR